MRTVQAQIKHMQIRSIFLKITQTTFFVICLMNGAYILLEVCWSLTCEPRILNTFHPISKSSLEYIRLQASNREQEYDSL